MNTSDPNSPKPGIFQSLFLFFLLLSFLLPASEVQSVEVEWQNVNVTTFTGVPRRDCEFENPLNGDEEFNDEPILNWQDADYTSPSDYDDWEVSQPGEIDGCASEIWLRQESHAATCTTGVESTRIIVNLNGDSNDGYALITVDGTEVALLDMYSAPNAETAVVLVEELPYTTHIVTVTVYDESVGGANDVAILGCAVLPGPTDPNIQEAYRQTKTFWTWLRNFWPSYNITAFRISNPQFLGEEDPMPPDIAAEIRSAGIATELQGSVPTLPTTWAMVNSDTSSDNFQKEAWFYFDAVAPDSLAPEMTITFSLPDMPLTTLDSLTGWYIVDFEVYANATEVESGSACYRLGPNPFRNPPAGITESPGVFLSILRQDQNIPNPFNPSTTIQYHLPRPADVMLGIYDVRGYRVRQFSPGRQEVGTHKVVWDGTDDAGRALASGTYLSVLEAGAVKVTRKITLLR